jgi:hypothetical protein
MFFFKTKWIALNQMVNGSQDFDGATPPLRCGPLLFEDI